MELSTYFRINEAGTGQFERTLLIAEEGSYVFEPPGETHTLVVPDDVDEMITYFQVNGIMYYVDPHGEHLGYEDVFTKIDMCRSHFENIVQVTFRCIVNKMK